jgi:O-antigen ligase
MKLANGDSTWLQSAGAAAITLMGAVGLAAVYVVGGLKISVVVFGTLAIAFALARSPNPRRVLLWMLLLSLPMALSKHFDEIVFKGGGEQSFRIELYDLFVAALLFMQLRDAVARRTPGIRVPRVIWFWVAVMMLGVIDVIAGPWRTSGAHELVRMFKVMLLFIVLVNEIRTPKQLLECAIPIAAGVLLQAGVAGLQYLKGGLLGWEVLGETTDKTIQNLAYTSIEGSLTFRPSGLLLHANILGVYFAITLPLIMAALLMERKFLTRVFLTVAFAAGLAGLILSQSRSAWVGFALGYFLLLALLVSHRPLKQRALGVATASGVTMLAVFVPFADRILTRLFSSRSDASVGREVFLGDFYRLIGDHWMFGTGLNSYSYEVVPYLSFSVSVYDNWVPPVHNIYYLWWAELGLLGAALHIGMWIALVLIGIRNLAVKDSTLFVLNAGCLGAMLALFFDGFLSFSLRVNQPQRFFFLFAAIFLIVHYWRRQHEPSAAAEAARAHRYRHAAEQLHRDATLSRAR